MATCSRGKLEVKMEAEKAALRHECLVELKHKLLEVAHEQLLVVNENHKTSYNVLEDETLLGLKQKLDAVAISGRRLSQAFISSLIATFIHRTAAAAIQSRKSTKQTLATEDRTITQCNDADCHPISVLNLAIPSAPGSESSSQVANRFLDTSSGYPTLPDMTSVVDDHLHTMAGGGTGFCPPKDILVEDVLKDPLHDGTGGRFSQTQLAALVRQRIDLDRQLSDERNLFAKRSAYLHDCRMAAEKEKEMAQTELAAAMQQLVAAEKERAVAASCRAAALDELKRDTLLRERNRPESSFKASLGPQDLEAAEKIIGYNAPLLQLHHDTAARLSPPLSACLAIPNPTPPDSANGLKSNVQSSEAYSTPATPSGGQPTCPKNGSLLHSSDDPQEAVSVSDTDIKDEVATIPRTLENPIGPYIRPPMPLEDMLRCVRCLFGKDKSLKTGNRARAFLGVPWSEIVSFDPDVLLRRGVLGIKEGSTGMASRLRMMTIIESALSNQNNDTIPAEVWERPTHFCESCQKRYPITVSSNEAVVSFEESVQQQVDVISSQASGDGNPRTQEITGASNPKNKRSKKRLRGTRQTTHPPR